MIKKITLFLVLALALASAQRWRGFNSRQNNEWNGQGQEENDPFNRPWTNNQQYQNSPWKNLRGLWNNGRQASTTLRTTIQSSSSESSTITDSTAYQKCLNRCSSINIYNPVCGTDGTTYRNPQKLQCAVRCGRTVSESYGGSCGR